MVSVPIGPDHLVAVVSSTHPYAGQSSVDVDRLRRQPLIVAPGDEEPAVVTGLRTLLGKDFPALSGATVARDIHIRSASSPAGWASAWDPLAC